MPEVVGAAPWLLTASILIADAVAHPPQPLRLLRGLPATTLRLTLVGDLMTHPDLSRMADYAEIYRAVEVFKTWRSPIWSSPWTKRDLREGIQSSATVV